MYQNVAIIGATGNVGRTLVSQMIEHMDTSPKRHKNPTKIILLRSSTNEIYDPNGIVNKTAIEFASKTMPGKIYDKSVSALHVIKTKQLKDEKVVFVDVTASKEEMLQFHIKVIRDSSHGIVTANKNPLTLSNFDTFQLLTSQFDRYGFRCSVMAGAEAVSLLRDMHDVDDLPKTIIGSFSGTLGYIMSALDTGESFSDAVIEAKKRGYTEPHPANDLNGTDVAKKALILSRTAGFNIKPSNIIITPCIPIEYLAEPNIEKFLNNLNRMDAMFEEKVNTARKKQCVLRYIAEARLNIKEPTITVGLRMLRKDAPLGSLKGTANKIFVVTNTYPQGYCVEAPGAGVEITAQNIRRDLLYQLDGRESN